VAYDDVTAARAKEVLLEYGDVDERKMFGGIAFMVKGYMVCGVIEERFIARLGPDGAGEALKDKHVRPMDFTGKPMKGYVYVDKQGIGSESELRRWIRSALDFVDTLPRR
jgi:TfoX/Sxy family transcriptional regulator of competence genes